MKNKIVKTFIILTLLIISIPFFLVILKIKIEPINKNDKHINLNFKRDFPLRIDLFKIYSYGKMTFFNMEPIPNGVIQAKKGWKFLGNKFSNALSESKGILVFNKRELLSIKKNLLAKKKYLEEQDIKLYISVAPNKHSIYGDLIPIRKNNRKTKFQQLDSLCKEIDINLIDLGSKFPKKDSIRLYHKTDSHWNNLGGFYAFRATIGAIKKDFNEVNFNFHKPSDIEVVTHPSTLGDLNRALFLKYDEEFIDFKLKKPFSFSVQQKQLIPPNDYHFGSKFYEERYASDVNDLKILVLRDSFFGAYYQLIADNFGKSLFVWRHTFNEELIASEKPNILCYEIVERNIDILITKDFNHSPN